MDKTTKNDRLALLAASTLFLAALITGGCKNGNDSDSYPSAVRMINGVASSDSLTVSVDDKSILGKIFYDDDSGYQGINPGTYSVSATIASQDSHPAQIPPERIAIEPNVRYTAVAYGTPSVAYSPRIAFFESPKLPSDGGKSGHSDKATVRVFNAAVGTRRIDVLVNSIVAFKNIPYGESSTDIPLAALPYEWNIKPAGSSTDTYMQPTTLTLQGGHAYLVVIMGRTDDQSLQIKAFEN